MGVGTKLQLKHGQTVAMVGAPEGIDFDLPEGVARTADPDSADAVVLFATTKSELDDRIDCVLLAARADRLAWVAYPKARQLGTDLQRDVLAAHVAERGVQPVRQIAIDDVWSALRFRLA